MSIADSKMDPSQGGPWIGRPLPRFEDLRLVRGAGRYTDDINLPGQVWAAFVRSPHAHAKLRNIDLTAALAMPGVLKILTGADYLAAGFGGMAQGTVSADAVEWKRGAFQTAMGHLVVDMPHIPFAVGTVRYPGEPIAVVMAETRNQARDAAEAVEIDYEILPSVTDAMAALQPDAPQIWSQAPGNLVLQADVNDRSGCEEAFATAALVVEQTIRSQRTVTAQMEPRSALGEFDVQADRYVLTSGCQGAHRMRVAVCAAMKLPPEKLRVIVPDTGGGFGTRTNCYPEQIAVLWAAKEVGRPVKWTGDRSECFLADYQGRDNITRARLALDKSGRILAYDVEITGNIGAHTVSFTSLHNGWRVGTTIYDIPKAAVLLRGVVTNTVPTAPYRGAGRPEATLVLERLLDDAAQRLGMDRMELRRRNIIPRQSLPYRTASGLTYDAGTFVANMNRMLELADWQGFAARREEAKRGGKLLGFGYSNYVETPVGAPHERAEIRIDPAGFVELVVGTQSTGQGHETSFAQVVADLVGVTPSDVRLVYGDTDKVASGGGSHSDRSMRLAGTLMFEAGSEIVDSAKAVAAHLLETDKAAVAFESGFFGASNNNRRLDIFEIARAVAGDPTLPEDLKAPLASAKTFTGRIPAFPTGAAACEIEIDPETGVLEITRYTTLDDAGQPVNPLILHGQAIGGIVQGAGPALTEGVYYDSNGQVLTGSFMDYGMPRAAMFPMFGVTLVEDATHGNPLRIKGGGEGGTTPATAVVMTAVLDALRPLGIDHLDMPATPEKVWQAIRSARK